MRPRLRRLLAGQQRRAGHQRLDVGEAVLVVAEHDQVGVLARQPHRDRLEARDLAVVPDGRQRRAARQLERSDLERGIREGRIETVLTVLPDLYGRLMDLIPSLRAKYEMRRDRVRQARAEAG